MIQITTNQLKDMVSRVKACRACNSEPRLPLQLINITVKNGILQMWALNGYQIQIAKLDVKNNTDEFSVSFEEIYIPKNDSQVQISVEDNELKLKYSPSGLTFSIPQNSNYEPFDLEGFIEKQSENSYEIGFTKEYLINALKGARNRDKFKFKFNPGSNLNPVQINSLSSQNDISTESYVLPVRIANQEV